MRETCLQMVHALAKQDPRVVFVGSDLGIGVLDDMKKNYPSRFYMEGISEQNLVGMAAGLAMEGAIVYVNTIATFLTRRCFEQVAVDLCMHNLNVRLIGNGGGLVYAPLGPTHEAIEDMAIMRALPHMTVIAVADAEEMRRMVPATLNWPGPIYIRVAKGHDRVVTAGNTGPFVIGQAVPMREGQDALILTTGVALQVCLEAAEKLKGAGIEACVLHLPTVKPLDTQAILDKARQAPVIVSVEEHTIIGGLGGAVAELLAESDLLAGRRFKRIGIPDVFADRYGDQHGVMRHYGISADNIAATVNKLLGTRTLSVKAPAHRAA